MKYVGIIRDAERTYVVRIAESFNEVLGAVVTFIDDQMEGKDYKMTTMIQVGHEEGMTFKAINDGTGIVLEVNVLEYYEDD